MVFFNLKGFQNLIISINFLNAYFNTTKRFICVCWIIIFCNECRLYQEEHKNVYLKHKTHRRNTLRLYDIKFR